MSTAATPRRRSAAKSAPLSQPAASLAVPPAAELRQLLGQAATVSVDTTSLLWGLPPRSERRAAERLVGEALKKTVSAARRRQAEALASAWLQHAEIDAAAAW